jgi:thioesterase domain-containing protein
MNHESGNALFVALKTGRPGPCFFLVPGIGVAIERYADLAASLRTAMPVFAIEPRGLDDSSAPDTSIEETGRHYLTRVRTVQEAGPYFLCGHSYGGLVALEIAQRLLQANEKVACVIMLDTPGPERLATKLGRHGRRLFTASIMENIKFYSRKIFSRGSMEVDSNDNKLSPLAVAHLLARLSYRPNFYRDKLIFFRPSLGDDGYDLSWRNRARELEIHSAAGDHISMIEPPNASLLAAEISECLAAASAAVTSPPGSVLELSGRPRSPANIEG